MVLQDHVHRSSHRGNQGRQARAAAPVPPEHRARIQGRHEAYRKLFFCGPLHGVERPVPGIVLLQVHLQVFLTTGLFFRAAAALRRRAIIMDRSRGEITYEIRLLRQPVHAADLAPPIISSMMRLALRANSEAATARTRREDVSRPQSGRAPGLEPWSGVISAKRLRLGRTSMLT